MREANVEIKHDPVQRHIHVALRVEVGVGDAIIDGSRIRRGGNDLCRVCSFKHYAQYNKS